MKYSLGISNFLEEISSLPILLLSSISLHWLLRKAFLSLLAILWNSALKWEYLSFSPLLFASLLFTAICKTSPNNHFAFLHSFQPLDTNKKIPAFSTAWMGVVLVAHLCLTLCDPMICPWNSLGKNTGVGCHCLLQGIFLTQGLYQDILQCRLILYCLSYQRLSGYYAKVNNKYMRKKNFMVSLVYGNFKKCTLMETNSRILVARG